MLCLTARKGIQSEPDYEFQVEWDLTVVYEKISVVNYSTISVPQSYLVAITTLQYNYDYQNEPSPEAESKWDSTFLFLLGYQFGN